MKKFSISSQIFHRMIIYLVSTFRERKIVVTVWQNVFNFSTKLSQFSKRILFGLSININFLKFVQNILQNFLLKLFQQKLSSCCKFHRNILFFVVTFFRRVFSIGLWLFRKKFPHFVSTISEKTFDISSLQKFTNLSSTFSQNLTLNKVC